MPTHPCQDQEDPAGTFRQKDYCRAFLKHMLWLDIHEPSKRSDRLDYIMGKALDGDRDHI